ncbi:MAG: hypothetical protein FJ144_28200 [Deltaproteobacteria bacterium]|nr:hypothetical protein [Deltaproteobacteria bacterium]
MATRRLLADDARADARSVRDRLNGSIQSPARRSALPAARSRFLLTAPPLRLPGAVGSPATPIATV